MEHKRITKICQYCGAKFEPAHNNAKYCSDECRKAGARENTRAWKKDNADKTSFSQKKYYRRKKRKSDLEQKYSPTHLDEIAIQYDTDYGAYQMEKTLKMVPKIDTDISRFRKEKEV